MGKHVINGKKYNDPTMCFVMTNMLPIKPQEILLRNIIFFGFWYEPRLKTAKMLALNFQKIKNFSLRFILRLRNYSKTCCWADLPLGYMVL